MINVSFFPPKSHFALWTVIFLVSLSSSLCRAQVQVWPPHWFSERAVDSLEILCYHPDGFSAPPSVEGKQLRVIESKLAANPQYAYILLDLGAQREDFRLEFWLGGQKRLRQNYPLGAPAPAPPQPMSPADRLYLITPDRFANGQPENDHLPGFKEEKYGREHPFGRHGGDLAGIAQQLDYLQELGVNSLWISPLLENDEPRESYHGYAITDHYRIDPRFGSNREFGALTQEMQRRGMKMIMDVVYNHLGAQHLLFRQPPDSSFFHFDRQKDRTNYRAVTLIDPHASQADRDRFARGWFDDHMPDINQKNPHVARFLIQNSLWWILKYGLDGFRIDTYAYPDQAFMAQLGRRIKAERPQFFLFGEIWVHQPEIQSYFAQGNPHNPHQSQLDAVTDFQFKYAAKEALSREQGWSEGVAKLYYRLAADYLYQDPSRLVTFIDNHDEPRVLGELQGDTAKLKVLLAWLYTMRGIPCLYYGTEIGLRETANHGLIRQPFPGGWPGDPHNKFTASGRNAEEEALYQRVKQLMDLRAEHSALGEGHFTHFIPEAESYVYFRHNETDTIMVVANVHPSESRSLDLSRFRELWPEGSEGIELLSRQRQQGQSLHLPPMSVQIIAKD